MNDSQMAWPDGPATAPNDRTADAVAWMRSSEMDRVAAYVLRGRAHSSLSDADLFDQWKLAFKDFTGDWMLAENRVRESDLKAEIDLRGLVPPWETVKDVLQNFNERIIQAIERTRQENPAALAKCDENILRAIDDFKADKQSSGN